MAGKTNFAFQRQNCRTLCNDGAWLNFFQEYSYYWGLRLEELTIMSPDFQSYSRNTLTLGLGRLTRKLQPTSLTWLVSIQNEKCGPPVYMENFSGWLHPVFHIGTENQSEQLPLSISPLIFINLAWFLNWPKKRLILFQGCFLPLVDHMGTSSSLTWLSPKTSLSMWDCHFVSDVFWCVPFNLCN